MSIRPEVGPWRQDDAVAVHERVPRWAADTLGAGAHARHSGITWACGQRPDATWESFGLSVPYLLDRAVALLG